MPLDTTAVLVAHLSKEIELATQLLIEQRTKNNLIVALGPFLVLGVIAANRHALLLISRISVLQKRIVSGLILAAYGILGILSAAIEEKLWSQTNVWRSLLAKLCGLAPEALVFPSAGIYPVYIGIYLALGAAFVGMLWLLLTFRDESAGND